MTLDRFTALPRRSRSVLASLVARHRAQSLPGRSNSLAHVAAWPFALRSVWKEKRDILAFLRTGDAALAHDLRRRFGLGAPIAPAQMVPDGLFDPGDPHIPAEPASIIIPIYNAPAMVARLLSHLPGTLNAGQHVILVDDGSEATDIPLILDRFEQNWSTTTRLRHAGNRGFVAAVNTALDHLPPAHHAVLLNSDTLPPQGWLPRLLAPFQVSPSVASVTPLSNNAEILSVPRPGIEGRVDVDFVACIDGVASRVRPRLVELPTGVGFCMALRRSFLDRLGRFDPVFGRGYGEEVDWCQRAKAIGGVHAAATNLFVGHNGAASFGAREKHKGVAAATRRIKARYPTFAKSALDWEQQDPVAPERLAMALGWIAATAQDAVPVFLAHSLGGGAETALQGEIRSALAGGCPAVVLLRVGGPADWRVELCGDRFSLAGDVSSEALIHKLLAPLANRHVVYSCGVGAARPERLPDVLLKLADGHRFSVRLHDFFVVSPSWNLLESDGQYHGLPSQDATDPAHSLPAAGVSHRSWRERWRRVMEAADEVTVFARSGQRLIEAAYVEAVGKVQVSPHQLDKLPDRLPAGGRTLGVLGGINRAKGGAVLERLGQTFSRRIVIIGEMDGQFGLPSPHSVLGRYDLGDIAPLARQHDIGAWFIPSIWPETFSFTTHEALATGLPVACFDIGAQAEAVGAQPNGTILDAAPDDTTGIETQLDALFRT